MRDKNSEEFNRGRHRIREWAVAVEDRRLNRDKLDIGTDLGLQFMLIFVIFLFKKSHKKVNNTHNDFPKPKITSSLKFFTFRRRRGHI